MKENFQLFADSKRNYCQDFKFHNILVLFPKFLFPLSLSLFPKPNPLKFYIFSPIYSLFLTFNDHDPCFWPPKVLLGLYPPDSY